MAQTGWYGSDRPLVIYQLLSTTLHLKLTKYSNWGDCHLTELSAKHIAGEMLPATW